MKKVLMVAFHYPPYEGGSGVHRTLKFSRYLPEHGWQPIVLSAQPKAYPKIGEEQLRQIPPDIIVKRAFALDTARHLSIGGRYLRFMALPDHWISWWFDAVRTGLSLVRRHRPDILWSTYPIATAHLIGLTLHRLTGLPWFADFRDSMTEDNYPRDPLTRRSYLWIERKTVKYASRLIFTAPSTRHMYLDRYPHLVADRCLDIPNGYDEEDFAGIEAPHLPAGGNGRVLRLLHAGVIYIDDRDPRAFFRAVAGLKRDGKIDSNVAVIDLRASGSENFYASMLKKLRIEDIEHLLPALSYRQALQDCAQADAFLLFQAASCNHQIPAKVYEYIRLGKPILGLTPPEGDTGRLLMEMEGSTVVDLGDQEAIYQAIPGFIDSIRKTVCPVPDAEKLFHHSRRYQAAQLAARLSEIASQDSPETHSSVARRLNRLT
jgi:glycosyltransferase involved in cell wall biosynthesis